MAGGTKPAVALLAQAVTQHSYQAKILDVPAAFHTALMEPVKPAFAQALDAIPLRPPVVPFLSSVTNRYVADPLDVRQNLVEQLTKPVEYVALSEQRKTKKWASSWGVAKRFIPPASFATDCRCAS